ncbi:MAG: alpha/beta hydrolase fold domain-containing protein, partial [Thermomicrobiales bacterium]
TWFRVLAIVAILLSVGSPVVAAHDPAPPAEPADGPGGQARTYPAVRQERFGDRPDGYWLFEPVSASGEVPSEPQPLVIFLHGFMSVFPEMYGTWVDHIVRGGAVLIFPDFQTLNPLTLRPDEYLENAMRAVESALVELEAANRASVDLANTAVVGHSVGGVLAVNYAALAEERGLPVPRVIMPVEPGGCSGCMEGPFGGFGLDLMDLSAIDPSSRAIVVAGDDDWVVGTEPARLIWESLSSLQPGHRDLVILRSDDHGSPELRADHLLPVEQVGGQVDALDWYGTWKLLDALMACAFQGSDCGKALSGSEFQHDMGVWSDGTKVIAPLIESA